MAIFYCKNCGMKEDTTCDKRKNYGVRTLIFTGMDSYKYLCDCPKCGYRYAVFFCVGELKNEGINEYIEWYVTDYIKDIIKEGK